MKDLKEKKNILVLGATGQVGYALVEELSKTNHSTTVLVRNRRLTFPKNIKVIEAETFTAEAFNYALENIDTVIYGVGLPEQFAPSKNLFERVNYDMLQTFLIAAENSNMRQLVYISTFEVFQEIDGVIRESHPHANEIGFSPYFQSKISAFRLATEFSKRTGTKLTTIHPGAVYGGLNTSYGITNYLENLLNWSYEKVPFIMPSRFPIVHATSLAKAIISSMNHAKAFIIFEQMTSLEEIAATLKKYVNAYEPFVVPSAIAGSAVKLMDTAAYLFKFKPVMSYSQFKLMTAGTEPKADAANTLLEWNPMSLDEGIQKYLRERIVTEKQKPLSINAKIIQAQKFKAEKYYAGLENIHGYLWERSARKIFK